MFCVLFSKRLPKVRGETYALVVVGLGRHNFAVPNIVCGYAPGCSHHNGFDKLTPLVPTHPLTYAIALPWESGGDGGDASPPFQKFEGDAPPPGKTGNFNFFKTKSCFE